MCGINGALVLDGGRDFVVTQGYLRRMRDEMAHRGPDGAGVWVSDDGTVGLGHRRLSIIDLSEAAAQPMENEDGSLRVVFNGEIYNHAEIRRELTARGGHRWRTDHSDTEVILHAFEEWGIDCIHRFRGMFAFALWDGRNRDLWLVRDRVGIKPLYYSLHSGRITFASEIKALLADPDQPREVDTDALFHFLSFLATPAPLTLFAGIRKVHPGTWMRIRADGSVREQRYWDVLENTDPLTGVSDARIAEMVLAELDTAVQLRHVADVPVGVFLSGGVDSSTLAALSVRAGARDVHSFTTGYRGTFDGYRDEFEDAARVARHLGTRHFERHLEPGDLRGFLPRMVEMQDEPLADPVCVPIYFVSELARRHGVPVCLVGEGADELFCGYTSWPRFLRLQRLADLPVPSFARHAAVSALRLGGREERMYYEWARRAAADQPVFWGGAEAFPHAQKMRLLSPALARSFGGRTSWEALEPVRQRFEANAWERTPLNWMTYLDLNVRLPDLLLMRVDKMSMAVGLEARVPFLDHRLVELAMSIPTATKLRGGLKHLLKRAVSGVVPGEVLTRPKQGFGVKPIYAWTLGPLEETVRAELREFCRASGLLDEGEVQRIVDQRHGPKTWHLLNLARWWSAYIGSRGSAELVSAA